MADQSRLENLRRRVQQDPSSIAFAQLAEEYRRAGQHEDAVNVCRAGLTVHPAYLSARVTLGRALAELNQLDEAGQEFEIVLKSAAENLAAIRGLADIHHRRGNFADALTQYRAALVLSRNDPDLEQIISDLSRRVEPAKPSHVEGLSADQARREIETHTPPPPAPVAAAPKPIAAVPAVPAAPTPVAVPSPVGEPIDSAAARAARTIAALEQWLQAIDAHRAQPGA